MVCCIYNYYPADQFNLIYPKVVGNSIGLPALWVLFAITVGGGLGGVLGMILGVPIVSIIYTLVNVKIRENEKPKKEMLLKGFSKN